MPLLLALGQDVRLVGVQARLKTPEAVGTFDNAWVDPRVLSRSAAKKLFEYVSCMYRHRFRAFEFVWGQQSLVSGDVAALRQFARF